MTKVNGLKTQAHFQAQEQAYVIARGLTNGSGSRRRRRIFQAVRKALYFLIIGPLFYASLVVLKCFTKLLAMAGSMYLEDPSKLFMVMGPELETEYMVALKEVDTV